jgi:hypothetical protein
MYAERMQRRSFLMLALGIVGANGCSRVPPLANTSDSPEALAGAVLDALTRGDRVRLDALGVSEQEFRDHVWPDLPAARPERNLPFSYVWGDLHQKSEVSLAKVLGAYGGKRHTLQRVTFADVTPYAHYKVHRDATFSVVDASGNPATIRVCGSFLEKDGAWKVFSYVIDD